MSGGYLWYLAQTKVKSSAGWLCKGISATYAARSLENAHLSCNKANLGHLEASAGMAGLLAVPWPGGRLGSVLVQGAQLPSDLMWEAWNLDLDMCTAGLNRVRAIAACQHHAHDCGCPFYVPFSNSGASPIFTLTVSIVIMASAKG